MNGSLESLVRDVVSRVKAAAAVPRGETRWPKRRKPSDK